MGNSEALNLERINQEIDRHDDSCPYELIRIEMAPFEVDRLDWPDIRGIPVVADGSMQTGRARLVCENDIVPQESIEAYSEHTLPA